MKAESRLQPEDLLDPANLPPELKWVEAQFRLQPNDPVYLLIAWHWHRIKASEDTMQAATLEMKTALDARIEHLAEAAEAIAGVNAVLTQMKKEMTDRPAILGKELETQLRQPVAAAVEQLLTMQKALGPVARSFRTVQRKHLLATLLIGICLGVIGTLVLFHA
ncbi:MAG: hypothetical protein NTZ29_15990 [Verrucomicrobia bacterium]|jgi:hypothetical protein|nr:hypothetical protein [Verrucomicrobiota bacterium]